MKIMFPDWASALQAAQDLDIQGCEELFLIHEGSLPYHDPNSNRSAPSYKGGTGRYYISDRRTGEFNAMTLKVAGLPHRFKPLDPNPNSKWKV
jgi:hypothetical protein